MTLIYSSLNYPWTMCIPVSSWEIQGWNPMTWPFSPGSMLHAPVSCSEHRQALSTLGCAHVPKRGHLFLPITSSKSRKTSFMSLVRKNYPSMFSFLLQSRNLLRMGNSMNQRETRKRMDMNEAICLEDHETCRWHSFWNKLAESYSETKPRANEIIQNVYSVKITTCAL